MMMTLKMMIMMRMMAMMSEIYLDKRAKGLVLMMRLFLCFEGRKCLGGMFRIPAVARPFREFENTPTRFQLGMSYSLPVFVVVVVAVVLFDDVDVVGDVSPDLSDHYCLMLG